MSCSATVNPSASPQSGPGSLPDPLRRQVKLLDIEECKGSERKILQIKGLCTIVEENRFAGWGFDSLEEYLQTDELSFKVQTFHQRRPIAGLPVEPFAGTNFSWQMLLRISRLFNKDHDLLPLIERARSGKALPALNKKRAPADLKDFELTKVFTRVLADAQIPLEVLTARAALCQEDRGVQAMDDAVRGLALGYLKARGLAPAEFFAERRAVEREEPAAGKNTTVFSESSQEEGPPGPKTGEPEPAAEPAPEAAAEPGPPAPEAQPQEEWYVPVARAVVDNLGEEEKRQLENHLVLALMGRPPATLVQFVRVVYDRIEGQVPQKIHDDLDDWLYIASRLDIKVRWNDIYNFWISAQLPGFFEDLHRLRVAELSPEQLQVMEVAWAWWPEPEPEPPPVPEGVDPEMWHKFGYLPESRKMIRLWEKIKAHPEQQYSIQSMGRAWLEIRKGQDTLESLERLLLRMLEPYEKDKEQPPAEPAT